MLAPASPLTSDDGAPFSGQNMRIPVAPENAAARLHFVRDNVVVEDQSRPKMRPCGVGVEGSPAGPAENEQAQSEVRLVSPAMNGQPEARAPPPVTVEERDEMLGLCSRACLRRRLSDDDFLYDLLCAGSATTTARVCLLFNQNWLELSPMMLGNADEHADAADDASAPGPPRLVERALLGCTQAWEDGLQVQDWRRVGRNLSHLQHPSQAETNAAEMQRSGLLGELLRTRVVDENALSQVEAEYARESGLPEVSRSYAHVMRPVESCFENYLPGDESFVLNKVRSSMLVNPRTKRIFPDVLKVETLALKYIPANLHYTGLAAPLSRRRSAREAGETRGSERAHEERRASRYFVGSIMKDLLLDGRRSDLLQRCARSCLRKRVGNDAFLSELLGADSSRACCVMLNRHCTASPLLQRKSRYNEAADGVLLAASCRWEQLLEVDDWRSVFDGLKILQHPSQERQVRNAMRRSGLQRELRKYDVKHGGRCSIADVQTEFQENLSIPEYAAGERTYEHLLRPTLVKFPNYKRRSGRFIENRVLVTMLADEERGIVFPDLLLLDTQSLFVKAAKGVVTLVEEEGEDDDSGAEVTSVTSCGSPHNCGRGSASSISACSSGSSDERRSSVKTTSSRGSSGM